MNSVITDHENAWFAKFFPCDYLPALNPSSHPVIGDAVDKCIHFFFCFLRRFSISPDKPHSRRRWISFVQQLFNRDTVLIPTFLTIPDYLDFLVCEILYTRVDKPRRHRDFNHTLGV